MITPDMEAAYHDELRARLDRLREVAAARERVTAALDVYADRVGTDTIYSALREGVALTATDLRLVVEAAGVVADIPSLMDDADPA